MHRNLRLQRIFFITLLAFILSAVMPFFAVYELPSSSKVLQKSAWGDKIFLCTNEGFKWVSIKDIQSGKESPKGHSQYKCPLCYIAHNGTKHFIGAGVVIGSIQRDVMVQRFMPPSVTIDTQILAHNAHPRAPPYSFVS